MTPFRVFNYLNNEGIPRIWVAHRQDGLNEPLDEFTVMSLRNSDGEIQEAFAGELQFDTNPIYNQPKWN